MSNNSTSAQDTATTTLPAIPYTPWLDLPTARQREASARTARVASSDDKMLGSASCSINKIPSNGEHESLTLGFTIPPTTDPETNEVRQQFARASASVTAEDWGSATIDGEPVVNLSASMSQPDKLGGHGIWHASGSKVCGPGGSHTIAAEGFNITMADPADNLFVFTCALQATVLESGGKKDPSKNECAAQADNTAGGRAASTRSRMGADSFATSSAATGITALIQDGQLAWSCNMGTLRGLGAAYAGRFVLTAEQLSAELATPAALLYSHQAGAYLEIPEGGVVPGALLNIHQGARVIALRYYQRPEESAAPTPDTAATNSGPSAEEETEDTTDDGTTEEETADFFGDILPVGVDTYGGGRASLNEDGSELTWRQTDGTGWRFSTSTGQCTACLAANDVEIPNVDDLLDVRCDTAGSLRQVWSYWDGLAQVEAETATSYVLAFYTPNCVSGQDASGTYLLAEGATPFKRFVIRYEASNETTATTPALHITEQSPGLPDYDIFWTQGADGGWSLTRGSGEEAVSESHSRSVLEEGTISGTNLDVWQQVIEYSKGGTVCARTAEVYQSTQMGDLLLTQVEGYGSSAARTTTYTYDGAGNCTAITSPEGATTRMDYDTWGRLVRTITPWGAGNYTRVVDTTYANSAEDTFNTDPAEVVEILNTPSGTCCYVRIDYYYYSTAEGIRRVERHSIACGDAATRLSVTETYTGEAENEFARGRLRMTQAENGVQTWYEYTACSDYGALYTESIETRVNGEAVRSQSTRRINYINAAGNTLRQENWVLLYNGTWAKFSGETYSYDAQNRRIGTTKDNGRSSTRTLTCQGLPLREVDEDGIQTDYAYDSARQLVEVSRAAVMDGEAEITPESIIEYTRDALGRALTTKRHTGAMLTQETTTYDLAGRPTSSTDALGRTTTYAYSADGLTTTTTQPDGATLITTRHASGDIFTEGGTGQPARQYSYDVVDERLCTRTLLADGQTILAEQHRSGFGDTVISARAVPGGFTYTRNRYNAKGLLVQTQQDTGLAPEEDTTTDAEEDTTETDEGGTEAEEVTTPVHAMAPTLYSYDSFGNVMRETIALAEEPNISNSRLTLRAYSKLQEADGNIYSMVTTTHNNTLGGAYNSSEATLISELSDTVESKSILTDPRGNISTSWVEYAGAAIRTHKQQLPTATTQASARVVDGFVTSQTDTAGVTLSQSRHYSATGMVLTQTDARGNTTTTHTDLAGRTVSVADATGATETTTYSPGTDLPACVTNAQGKTTCYRYDLLGRKVAEWGTAVQPALFGYDAEGNLTHLTTFRAGAEDISTDPAERTDGDTTTWAYDLASGLELSKTYADGSTTTRTYDGFGRLATETNARGTTKTFSYLSTTGELSGIVASDGSMPAQAFTYTLTGKLATVVDAAGTRSIAYNEYDEPVSDTLTADEVTHLITENRDACGRSSGFAYSKAGSLACAEQYGYGADGRLATAAFSHGGEWKSFAYSYLPGTHLLQTLTMPNGMTLTQQYEAARDLLTGMEYKRGSSGVVERYYTYDTLGRPQTRIQNRNGGSRSDAFTHNDRSELTAATLDNRNYAYTYDNIGNRQSAQENAEEATAYTANALNQYTAVGEFVPEFDADGNQTKVQTSTGIWNVAYNAENRPVEFTRSNDDGSTTRVSCDYDYMGRRATKKVELLSAPDAETGESTTTVTLHQRYIYRGYLQIACCDLTREAHPHLWLITWDPTQPTATRPLAIQKDATWYVYGWDLTKNICEVFNNEGYMNNTVIYSYSPYGAVTAEGTTSQPIQWSSEFYDEELGLVYYNYRLYNPIDGRWICRDREQANNLYVNVVNAPVNNVDVLGDVSYSEAIANAEMREIMLTIGPLDAYSIKDTKQKAEACVADMIGLHGGNGDAVRHCTWLCLMSQKIGSDQALEVGNIHERHSPPSLCLGESISGYDSAEAWAQADTDMDVHNNGIGATAVPLKSETTLRID